MFTICARATSVLALLRYFSTCGRHEGREQAQDHQHHEQLDQGEARAWAEPALSGGGEGDRDRSAGHSCRS